MKPERCCTLAQGQGGRSRALRDVLPNPRMQPTSAGARLCSGGTLLRELDCPRLMRNSLGGPDDSPVT